METKRDTEYAKSLSRMIQVKTVSSCDDREPFNEFHKLLREMFPELFKIVTVEDFDGSLLLRWEGKEKSGLPVLLMSHHDVVEAPGDWTHPPFSGETADGKLWGRGTLDTKCSLWAMMQAAEELIREGFAPSRDIYFESACNEETSGAGADMISKVLKERGIRFFMSVDEGGMMLHDPIGGVDGTFAMVGVGEKACVDLKFTARSNGGHASTPSRNTPLVRLGKFMAKIDRSEIFEAKIPPVVEEMFRRMAPAAKGYMKFVLRNSKKLEPVLIKVLPKISTDAGAMVKTTIAFTMAQGSAASNVLPQEAWVAGNMRVSHHQGCEKSIEAVKRIAKKYGITVEVIKGGPESGISDYGSEAFKLVEKAVSTVFPGVISVPYIMNGASDSRFFDRVSDVCIRFAPFLIDKAQLASIHGKDENINIETLGSAVDFYKYIIKGA